MKNAAASAVLLVLLASGARAADSAWVEQLKTDYMDGKWDQVAADVHAHKSDLPGLSGQQRADADAIVAAYEECRQPWWNECKAGKKTLIHAKVWNQNLDATFDPGTGPGVQINGINGMLKFGVSWDPADMDSDAKGEHGFTKGEIAELGVWMNLGSANAYSTIPQSAMMNLTDESRLALTRFIDFRSALTGAYYGSPRVRRWAFFLYLNTFASKYDAMQTALSRRAIGAMFLCDLLANPSAYPSIKFAMATADDTENKVAGQEKGWIEKHPWTLAEDNHVRALIKAFTPEASREAFRSGVVTLPNKLRVALDPEKDKALVAKRDAWVKAQLEKDQ